MGSPDTATRRTWIVQLYFSLAALVGLGFLIAGVTTALFGAKDVAFPELGIQSYSYEGTLHRDAGGNVVATDEERAAARQRAIDDARRGGLDQLVDGAILVLVGTPTLVWHLRRGRLAERADRRRTAAAPPEPSRQPSRQPSQGPSAEPSSGAPAGTS
jgi:hypothetical protein